MKKPNFILSRKNQQGQVAIFVALIFQVIFVFFALLINVGLLVHQKINLQQSTDLAAYYGAMKQAESLNAMAHVNYQLRQAWKLLTWRYRVLGTFGMQNVDRGVGRYPTMPVTMMYPSLGGNSIINDETTFNNFRCPPTPPSLDPTSTATTPFFCIGHAGMKGWPGGENENVCKVNCDLLSNQPYNVQGVSNPPPVTSVGQAQQIHSTLSLVNNNLVQLCNSLGKANIEVLAQMILAYRQEMMVRSQTIQMLAGNLSNDSKDMLDLDGKLVLDGVSNTLKNNLTEANKESGSLSINSYNSLSNKDCSIDKTNPASNHTSKKEFLKRIEFDFINFYIHACKTPVLPANSSVTPILDYIAGSIYNRFLTDLADGTTVTPTSGGPSMKTPDLTNTIGPAMAAEIMKLIGNVNEKYTVGYEKNPWCPAYFVVQASSSPRIPFLPLIEIKLNAVSVAKPFGGSIGPWYGKTWNSSNETSQAGIGIADATKQTDENLPVIKISNPPNSLKESARLLPNFSRFVGDDKGVSDVKYLGEYHAALITRLLNRPSLYGNGKVPDPNQYKYLYTPLVWPSLTSWDNTYDLDSPGYDPLTRDDNNNDSYLRDLEVSAIAPNQFDLTYYSIDSDFYNNYYSRLSDPVIFGKLKSAAGLGPSKPNYVRPDFGNNKDIYSQKKEFSVRNQVEIVKKVFADSGFNAGLVNSVPFIKAYPELATKQSSLLTGWTFSNFTNFDSFPGGDMTQPTETMNFARCSDKWQSTGLNPEYKNPIEIDPKLPSTPGNCVTGGRVGYSVKLVSPSSLSATATQSLGGPNTSGVILNPIPTDILNNF